jgi:hypothetical protein
MTSISRGPQERLRVLWDAHRRTPFPQGDKHGRHLQEVALYESWLGSVVEAALARGGRLSPTHRLMLDVRQAEGNRPIWTAAAEAGDPVRSYVARLLEIEALLSALPVD